MMKGLNISEDIRSLTEFKRNTAEFMGQLEATGRPLVLTVNGEAKIVVQDAAAYQKLLELVDRLEAIEGIRKGLESMKAGRGRPAHEVLEEIRVMLNIPADAKRPKK